MRVVLLIAIVLALSNSTYGKIFSKCELVKKISTAFPRNKLADWNCLVSNESKYNSGVRSRKNRNGSYDYGNFQINDNYWCKVGRPGGDCNIDCNSEFGRRVSK